MNDSVLSKTEILGAVEALQQTRLEQRDLTLAIATFIQVTDTLPVKRLEYWESHLRHEEYLFIYSTFPIAPDHRRLIPWLDICSYNGFIREKALKNFKNGAPNSLLMAFVLKRLNDWVPQVQAAARQVIPAIATKTQTQFVVEALWGILPHLYSWQRLNPSNIDVLFDIASLPDVSTALISKLIHVPHGPVAAIFGQLGRSPILDQNLMMIAEQAIQPAVRAKAYRSQIEQRITWFKGYEWIWRDHRWCQRPVLGQRSIQFNVPLVEIVAKAARDRSPIVRRIAGNALFNLPENCDLKPFVAIAKHLAKDAYPSVAERGQFALKRFRALEH